MQIPERNISANIESLDNFFGNLGQLIGELKILRKERDFWKEKCSNWASRVVELQNTVFDKKG